MGVPAEVAAAPESERFGKFVRVAPIGTGGMGEVWKAWDVELGRWVALKFLRTAQGDELARFRREAQTAAKLSHPNIAAVYEVAEDRGRPFIAMQYIDGVTLKKVPRRDRRALAAYVRDAARAVGYGHAQGIIHRDLKPENVMVADGHVFVTDFGLARPAHGATQLTVTGDVVGTPAYMSPEQAGGEPLDAGTDVWSLGATLYELLTDGPPFHGANSLETMLKIREEDPVPPRRIDPTIDPDLETIVLTCLEKPRDRRYVTATALAADLDRWLRGEPIQARRAGALTLIARRLSRRKALVVLAALAAIALPAGIGGAWVVRAQGRRLAEQQEALRRRDMELLVALRRTADASLDAALATRRAGDLHGMQKHADRLREDCERVMRELPRAAEPHFLLGRMARALMRDEEALERQERALALDPNLAAARYERAVLKAQLYGRLCKRATEAARSVDAPLTAAAARAMPPPSRDDVERIDPRLAPLRLAVEEDARWLSKNSAIDEAAVRTVRGLLAYHAQDLDQAIRELRAAADLDPLRGEAWETLGIALMDRSRASRDPAERQALMLQARQTLVDGANLDRGNLPLVAWLAEAHAACGRDAAEAGQDPTIDWGVAEDVFRGLLSMAPGQAEIHNDRGRLRSSRALWRMSRGEDPEPDWRDAEADFEAAVRLHPSEVQARRGLASIHAHRAVLRLYRGEDPLPALARGERELTDALGVKRDDADVLAQRAGLRMNRALHLINTGGDPLPEWKAAEDDFTEAIRVNRRIVNGWYGRASLRTNRGVWREQHGADGEADFAAAEEDAGEALRLGPASADSWRARGRLRTFRGLRAAARQLDPGPHWSQAQADFEEALRINPREAEIWIERARLYASRAVTLERSDPAAYRRDLERAVGDLESALRLNAHLERHVRPMLEECRRRLQ